MPLSPVDPAYEPIKYLEKEIKIIKREIKLFKQAHDMAITQLNDAILKTQRSLAIVSVSKGVYLYTGIIGRKLPQKASGINKQIVINAGKANERITVSEEPLLVADEFEDECNAILREHKVELLWY